MRAAALAVAMLVFGFIFGGTLGFVVGGAGTVTITTTAVVPTTLISTETRLTTVEVTRTQFATSLVTVTQTVTPSPQPTVGETYLLKILEVVVDRVSDIGQDYYIFMLEASYKGGRSWNFNILNLNLVSDKGYKYSIEFSLAVRQLLGAVELKDGETAKGQISFKLPKGENPSKLIYEDKLWGIKIELTDISPPRGQVSWIYLAETNVQSGYSFIWASALIKTPGAAFYSGEEIEVELSIKYSKLLGNPDSITITSITVDKFEIVKIDPRLPFILKDGEEVKIKLVLRVPEEGYKGNLKITIRA
jgi:hypothetical protein